MKKKQVHKDPKPQFTETNAQRLAIELYKKIAKLLDGKPVAFVRRALILMPYIAEERLLVNVSEKSR